MLAQRYVDILTVVMAVLLASPLGLLGQSAVAHASANVRTFDRHVETHPSRGEVQIIEGASARLMTTEEGAFVHISTHELNPGHVYTLWWVVFNDPAACQTSPCTGADAVIHTALTQADVTYGGGIIAGDDGSGIFNSYIAAQELPNAWFGNGYHNAMGAEIHLVINDHGMLIPEMATTMLQSYRGGCTDESLPGAFPDTAKNDGIPGPNTCQLFQDVIFQQR
jgi:hypothetical protein